MKKVNYIYCNLITLPNVFSSYDEFKKGKRKSKELQQFERNLEDNLFCLYEKLKNKKYKPGIYTSFYVQDPKQRLIHKAPVIDRIVHHLVSKKLEEIFEPTFISHSYSCRKDKGTHKGLRDLQRFTRKVSKNNTQECWALKCDVKKFFASVNQVILFQILEKKIIDKDFLSLLRNIIKSFNSNAVNKGMPIGNLISQLFANIYLNELDQYVKQKLKIRYYIRYMDDFVILSSDRSRLEKLIPTVKFFLENNLDLELHPKKVKIFNLKNGIDFLGYILFSHLILPRTKTKRRMIKKIREKIEAYKRGVTTADSLYQTVQSYLGYLQHSNSYELTEKVKQMIYSELDF
jgi:retron-type reverse transcriptase